MKINFFKDFIYLLLEREQEREREGEKHHGLPLTLAPAGDSAHNLGMCPDQESNGMTPRQLSHTTRLSEN